MLSLAAVTVLAHQGGWDEMLMVLTPIAVFALLLKMANTRAKRAAGASERGAEGSGGPGEPWAEGSGDPTTPDEPLSPA